MKRIITILSTISLVGISTAQISACAWKTPPISVEELSEIFENANKLVLESPTPETGVAKIASTFAMSWDSSLEADQTIEKSKLWSEGLTGAISTHITSSINENKNILKDEDYKYSSKDVNNLVLIYHFTIRINDIYSTNTSKWLSDKKTDKGESAVKKQEVLINGEKVKVQENNLPIVPNENEENYSVIDNNALWKLQDEDMKSTEYLVRYLFSFSPIGKFSEKPTLFYVEASMEK